MTFPSRCLFSWRHLVERYSRHLVFTRRLPARFGALRLRVSPGASLTYYRGLRQRSFTDLYDFAEGYVQPGQTVWDVGPNMGVFAFAAAARARIAGRVLCLEPDLWSVSLLRRSCRYNRGRAAPVDVLPVAISDDMRLEWLNIPERCRAATHLASSEGGAGEEITGAVREQHLVPTVTLDWLAGRYPVPQVIKIDVDGSEYRVLAGGRTLLRQHRPVLLTEVYERNADTVSTFLHELDYALFDYDHGEAGKHPIARAVYNTLALPLPR
ncbi:MAG TPA: FkbM family methyltransferase [Opitutaceae bacterium]|nr:FkbM family methyltransferase [Opitutaceae bacterium]